MSHVNSVGLALEETPLAGVEVLRIPTKRSVERTGEAHPAFDLAAGKILPERLANSEPDVVVLSLGGNEHNLFAMVEHPQPFALVSSDAHLESDSQYRWLMPAAVFRDLLVSRRRAVPSMIAHILETFPRARKLVMLPPPPMENGPAMQEMRHLTATAEEILQAEIGTDATRMAAYQINIDIILDEARSIGARAVAPPPNVLTATGFLKVEFCYNVAHGNGAYGRRMPEHIRRESHLDTSAA